MSCIVYQIDKKTGVKYAYESTSYWDKEKQQPRSTRKYIGKVDPETGEIIRKKERKQLNDKSDELFNKEELVNLYNQIKEKDQLLFGVSKELQSARKKIIELENTISKIRLLTEDINRNV